MDRDGECQATMDDLILEKPFWQASIKRTRPWKPCVALPRQHESGIRTGRSKLPEGSIGNRLTPQLDSGMEASNEGQDERSHTRLSLKPEAWRIRLP
jgi:hypothetical protein